ncbi:MAG: hypothetical protein JXR97_09365 [Planctomycetes bacterium]|nr:hypothetical protein [Planctomycetota bacterium]
MRYIIVFILVFCSTCFAEEKPALTFEALIDGGSELHVKQDGVYWIHKSKTSLPGKHRGLDAPTVINGKDWMPKWSKGDGFSYSDVCEISLPYEGYTVKLVNASVEKGKDVIEPRTPVEAKKIGEEFVVTIPDKQGGSCWYKIALIPTGKTDTPAVEVKNGGDNAAPAKAPEQEFKPETFTIDTYRELLRDYRKQNTKAQKDVWIEEFNKTHPRNILKARVKILEVGKADKPWGKYKIRAQYDNYRGADAITKITINFEIWSDDESALKLDKDKFSNLSAVIKSCAIKSEKKHDYLNVVLKEAVFK